MNQSEFHAKERTYDFFDTYEKIKRLLDFEKGGLNILDVGCGSGILGEHLAKNGNTVTGLDIDEYSKGKNFNFIKCDIALPWPVQEKSFDVVICTDVLEHCYDMAHIFKQAERVLKDSGVMIVGIPNHFDLRQRFCMFFGKGIVHWDQVRYREKAWSYGHVRFMNLFEAREFFAELEWRIIKEQFNFMGAGIIPTRFTPSFIRRLFLKTWPNVFSGKFLFLLQKKSSNDQAKKKSVYVLKTMNGM
jgi:2-polyprenyl-3-methyl-5-hydroxy-6-metoxy-1,4-benzoquinol methylase